MVGELIMLPVRVGVRVTRLWFRVVEETASIATSAAGHVIGRVASRSSNGTYDAPRPRQDASGEPGPPPREDELRRSPNGPTSAPARPSRRPRDLRPAPAPDPPPSAEPVHVSEEPELVEEFAEPGAEQGAGAEVRIDPPWDDYDRLNAREVVSRIASADPAELAAVQLYESSKRGRQTILNAVQRELRIANGSGSRANQRGRTDQR